MAAARQPERPGCGRERNLLRRERRLGPAARGRHADAGEADCDHTNRESHVASVEG